MPLQIMQITKAMPYTSFPNPLSSQGGTMRSLSVVETLFVRHLENVEFTEMRKWRTAKTYEFTVHNLLESGPRPCSRIQGSSALRLACPIFAKALSPS